MVNERAIIKKFGIHIKVSDFNRSYQFYKNLGFEEEFAYGPQDFTEKFKGKIPTANEKYKGVTFNLNGSLFEIGEKHIAVKPKVFKEQIKSSKVSAMLHVDSLDEVLKQCKKHKIIIAVPPRKFPWGTKELVVKDPDGFVLVFIEGA